jgi:hypothetical protein
LKHVLEFLLKVYYFISKGSWKLLEGKTLDHMEAWTKGGELVSLHFKEDIR